jgi:hypothetical protein
MSLATTDIGDPDLTLNGVTYDHVRKALNPLDHGWMPYFRVLTKWYMHREDRDWSSPGPHHERWFRDFRSGRDLIRLAHRGSLKTTSTLAYVLGNLEYRSGFHAAWIGNNETLAYEKAHSEFDKLVDRNPWLTQLQPENRTTDQKGKKEFANDSSLSVGWLFGGVEGRHVDLLVVDDLIKEKGDGDMQEIEDWLSSVIVPVQEHGGQTIVIGTRKTPTDVYSLLADREGFDFVEHPAILEEWDGHFGESGAARRPDPDLYHTAPHPLNAERDVNILWEERSTDYLADAHSKQSEYAWLREFCLIVQTREGAVYGLFERDRHVTDTDLSQKTRTWYGLDWGSGNPAGFVTFVERPDGQVTTIAEEKYPADGTQDYVNTLTTLQEQWGVGTVYCDPSDKRGIDDLRDEGIDAVASENDIEAGIRVVKDHLADGTLDVHERCEHLREEIGAYRYNQSTGKPVKKNDHLADAWRYGLAGDRYVDDGPDGSGTW